MGQKTAWGNKQDTFHKPSPAMGSVWPHRRRTLVQLSFLTPPSEIIAQAGDNNQDPALLALLQEAAKGVVKRKRGIGKAIWNRFESESKFSWATGASERWTIPQDVFDKSGGNGGSWVRRGSVFRDRFVLKTFYSNGTIRLDDGDGNTTHIGKKKGAGRIVAIQLCGYIPPNKKKLSVPDGMQDILVAAGVPAVCAVSGTSDVEVDHKEGRPDPLLGWAQGPDPDLYQFLSRANNNVKKSACKRCVETGIRFDAGMLGFKKRWLEGDATYEPVQKCRGCYWFDVRAFHANAT
jgi:ICEA Protein